MNNPGNLEKILPQPQIGVGGILFNSNGEVLLIKRNQPPAHGLWSIPGGRLEPGETLVSCCRREFYEETDIIVEVKHICAVVERQLEGFHYVIIDFCVELADPQNAEPIAQTDVAEARWVRLDELHRYELVIGLADIIHRAKPGHVKKQTAGLHDINLTGTDFIA